MWPWRRKQPWIFSFRPQWKEEMHVTGPGGTFVLDFPMGNPTIVLPDEQRWAEVAPAWARELWPELHRELAEWCRENNTALEISGRASVW